MMRRETTHAERVEMIERHNAGETLGSIAQDLQLNLFTVRHWWRLYRDRGYPALMPLPCGPHRVGPLGRYPPLVKYVALRLKREHPGWGPQLLRLQMQRRPSLQGLALPGPSALWAYLHRFKARLLSPRRLVTRRPPGAALQAAQAHQCWQMDFKGEELVAGCQAVVFPFGLVDEASGAPLLRVLHALRAKGNHLGLTMRHVQADLRLGFVRWGLPDAVRMDHDPLFIGSARFEWPGTVPLWLVGLGIMPLINRAYHPTDNALIERSHRTWYSDTLAGVAYADLAALDAASEQRLEDRRRHLPSRHRTCHGQPPLTAFPELGQARRPYSPAQERSLFDLRRVDAYLAAWEWRRQVDSTGKISLADRNLLLHRRHAGQVAKIRFDPGTRQFVCSLDGDEVVASLTLTEVSEDYILGLGGIT